MKLIHNWRTLLRKAWSLRLMIVAAILSGVEVALPFFSDALPRGTFAALSAVTVALAFAARLVAQKGVEE